MTITLREITEANWRQVARLKLAEGQEHFVAPNWYSMLEALHSGGNLHSRAIYDDDRLIGYTMFGFDPKTNESWIVRLMTDKDQQRKGYGRTAMSLIIDQLKQMYASKEILISFEPTNNVARALYEKIGFRDTGRIEDGELVFGLKIDA
ncbi:MAG: GNAT family N-acetyltransferase [Anaerolineae bacterium]